jgi:hypothetical protein
MTAHTIAYVAIQVSRNHVTFFLFHRHLTYDTEQARFAMSSTGTWANIDGPFVYSDFYWRIVGLFEDQGEAATHIQFFNQYVQCSLSSLFFILLILFLLCSHVFGTGSDQSGLEGGQVAAAAGDVEDEYDTVRRQRSEKRARIARQRSASLEA